MMSAMAEVKPTSTGIAGFQPTEIGLIPSDWQVEELGCIGSAFIGLTYGPSDVHTDGTLVLRSSNVQNGRLRFDDNVFVKVDVPDRATVRENDILICVRNGSRDLIGKSAVIDAHSAGMAFGAFMGLYRSEHNNFLAHVFKSDIVLRQIHEHLGATINQITNKSLSGFKVPLPQNTDERKSIAEALSDADALIESLEQLTAKKRDIKQGAMQELLSGKRRLEGFTEEWSQKSFGEIFDFLSTATNSRSDLREDEGAYYVHYGDIHTRFHSHLDFRSQQPSRIERSKCKNAALIKNGDWIMADASEDLAGVGKCIEIAGLSNGDQAVSGLHTFLLREKQPTFVQGFKGHLSNLKSLHGQYMRVMTGMKVFGISKSALKNLMLPVPSQPEQQQITAILNEMDSEIQALEIKVEKFRHCKQGMLQELLTGRIRLA